MNENKKIVSKSFEDLLVWQRAHAFVLDVYKTTKDFPKEELFGITSQFRNAARSIPSNIAEGYKRRGKADKLRFFNFAQGSLEESRYYVILSKDLVYINQEKYLDWIHQVIDISQLLNSYCNVISKSI